jgi:hypothetical protein
MATGRPIDQLTKHQRILIIIDKDMHPSAPGELCLVQYGLKTRHDALCDGGLR